jgi:hypothetical protein
MSAGKTCLRVQREADESHSGDLLLYSLEDVEDIVAENSGIPQLIEEQ